MFIDMRHSVGSVVVFFKQKTAYEMRISDWSSDVCSSDLKRMRAMKFEGTFQYMGNHGVVFNVSQITLTDSERGRLRELHFGEAKSAHYEVNSKVVEVYDKMLAKNLPCVMMIGISKPLTRQQGDRSEEHTSELQSLMRISYAVFCLKKKKTCKITNTRKKEKIHTN